jgi:2-polyprenyl-3-methyl-5-hydroxy-6-metoxy-1,4-benzoquinol methylase
MDARDSWNNGADGYIQFIESGADYYRTLVHGPALLDACGDVNGKRVLDIGCGYGYFSRKLAEQCAQVSAVDISDRLIQQAERVEAEKPLGIHYFRDDAKNISDLFSVQSFDLVTGCMSVQDMDEPAVVIDAAFQLLTHSGRLVISVPHPCTDPPHRVWQKDMFGRKLALSLDRYFETGPAVCDWSMPRLAYRWQTPYRRLTLTDWSCIFVNAGFVIRSLSEPRPTADLVQSNPNLHDCSRMPYFIIFDLEKRHRNVTQ